MQFAHSMSFGFSGVTNVLCLGTIRRSDCREALESGPAIILVPVRLGTHNIDISYVPKVASMLGLSQVIVPSLGFDDRVFLLGKSRCMPSN